MAEKITQKAPPSGRAALPSAWSAGTLLIALLVLLPICAVIWLAFNPTENIWPHLISTTLPRYLGNSALLMAAVALLAAIMGTITAWLVAMYRFPLSRWLDWLLLLPLAVPAYVGAYALVDFLEYAGPVQSGLRTLMGWSSARDYWFPEVRSRGAAVLVLSAALYPYVYLLARAAFREQAGGALEVARTLGAGPLRRFFRVALPLARPAVAAGTAIVMMETVADFGVVDFFAVQTLTTGIFSVWLEAHNAGGAAQIASVVLMLVLLLVGLEKFGRRRLRFHGTGRQIRPLEPTILRGPMGWIATTLCAFPFLMGFALPVGVISNHALGRAGTPDAALLRALGNTVLVSSAAALIAVLAALVLVYGVRLSRARLPAQLLPATTLGYAAPGAVLGIGILIPLAAMDHALADGWLWLTGHDPGLLLTGSATAVIYAYCVRFFAIAQGSVDAAMGRITPSLPMAARSLGRNARTTLTAIYLPLISGSVGTALLLVFVDSVKELPATLLLRPFNFNTLATRTYESASLEDIAGASPSALMICAVGMVAVLLLARTNHTH